MKLTFICNACAIIEQDGSRLLTDPWLTGGAFEGAWYHYPPLATRPQHVCDVDYLYLSHLHPDHFDPDALACFRRDIPVVALDHGENFLIRMLRSLGFSAIVALKDGEARRLGPFEITLFAPFSKHAFHETAIGNLIDSALVVTSSGQSILDTNDNTLTAEAAARLRQRFGRFTVAQLNYNAAGPYPACFNNLSQADKFAEHERVLQRNIAHLAAIARILEPRWVMPFAGAYVLGGKQAIKNSYLGTTTWDDAAARLVRLDPGLRALVMHEGLTFDLATGDFVNGRYVPVDVAAQERYIAEVLAPLRYPHEFDLESGAQEVLDAWIRRWLAVARSNLWRMQERFAIAPDCRVYLRLGDRAAELAFGAPEIRFIDNAEARCAPFLEASLDPRLLARILTTAAHWNNAEIGCHIDFWREPNTYHPDVHILLSFLHIPRARIAEALGELPHALATQIAPAGASAAPVRRARAKAADAARATAIQA
jgi:UDP-MurNAc hydroxylase